LAQSAFATLSISVSPGNKVSRTDCFLGVTLKFTKKLIDLDVT